MKKNNLRQCLICKKKLQKHELIRFIIKDNTVFISNEPSRGYYINANDININQIKDVFKKRFNAILSDACIKELEQKEVNYGKETKE